MASSPNAPIEPIMPEAAAAILEPEVQRLEADGWVVMVQTDYMARLTRGRRNMELYVDLLGELSIQEKPLDAVQESGRIVAIMLLLVTFIFILTLLSILGILR